VVCYSSGGAVIYGWLDTTMYIKTASKKQLLFSPFDVVRHGMAKFQNCLRVQYYVAIRC
jgi:hypothetical protein